MKTRFSACLALLLLAFATPSQAAEEVGKITSAKASVFSGGTPVQAGDSIFFKQRLSTNSTGVGEFSFQDGTKLALGPSASLVVDEFVVKNQSTFKKFGINATKGTFRWISGNSPHSAYNIKTPRGTMGIQGTGLDVTTINGVTYMVLLNGRFKFCTGAACVVLNRSGDYVSTNGRSISPKQQITEAFKNRAEAGRYFPFLANPNMLSPKFRVAGSYLLFKKFKKAEGNGKSGPDPKGTKAAASQNPPQNPVQGSNGRCATNCGNGGGNGGLGNLSTTNEGRGAGPKKP